MPIPEEYVRAGWSLCAIPRGQKGPTSPGWNLREHAIVSADRAARLTENVGLLHAYSGTCALDVDDLDGARVWLLERGVDLDKLLAAADAVQISSGRPGRAKLVYKLLIPLPSRKISLDKRTLLEFRCGTADGKSVQDVLPPSIHPETQKPYEWVTGIAAEWNDPPQIPAALLALWQSLVAPTQRELPASSQWPANIDEVERLLQNRDPDAPYDEWLEVGMALHHELGDEGLALWDDWSSKGAKYIGLEDLETHWRSFGHHPRPVTLASLRSEQVASADDFDVVTPTLADAKPAERFAFVPWPAFSAQADIDWHIDDILPQAEICMVYGESGSGKTFLVLDLVSAVARGVQWRARDSRPGQVCYVVAEGAVGFRKRIRALAHQVDAHQLSDMRLLVLGDAPNLFDRDQALAVAKAVNTAGGASIIVIDTLSAVAVGANENSGEDMNQIVAHCKGLHRATGALVILVHHSGKDTARGARGWSGIRAAADAEIEVSTIGETRIATVTKMKDGEDGQVLAFRLVPVIVGIDAKGKDITSCVVEHIEVPAAAKKEREPKAGLTRTVLGVIRDLCIADDTVPEETIYDVAVTRMAQPDGLRDRRRDNARRALQSLIDEGFVTKEGDNICAQ